MNLKNIAAAALAIFLTSTAKGQIVSATLDILDGSDPGAPTPPGIIVLDGFVDVATTDTWTAAGVRCETSNGTTLVYADGDANVAGIQPRIVNPGSGNNRFVTVLSRPRGRDSVERFDNGAAAIAATYDGGPPPALQTPHELNVAYFANPPVGRFDPSVDGFVLRLAFHASGQDAGTVILTATDVAPDAFHPTLLASIMGRPDGTPAPGWVNSTYDVPAPVGRHWFLWGIPEPASVLCFGMGVAFMLRRRRGELR